MRIFWSLAIDVWKEQLRTRFLLIHIVLASVLLMLAGSILQDVHPGPEAEWLSGLARIPEPEWLERLSKAPAAQAPGTKDFSIVRLEDLPDAERPTLEYTHLSNGSEVCVSKIPRSSEFFLGVAMRGGALQEPPGRRGLTAYALEWLDASLDRPKAGLLVQPELRHDWRGALLSLSGPAEFGPELTRQFIALLVEPPLDPALRSQTLDGLCRRLADPREQPGPLALALLKEGLFPAGSRLLLPKEGSCEELRSLREEDLRQALRSLLAPRNTLLALSGRFSAEALLPLLDAGLSGLQEAPPAPPPPDAPIVLPPGLTLERSAPRLDRVWVSFALASPRAPDARRERLRSKLLDALLLDLLFYLRERGLVYSSAGGENFSRGLEASLRLILFQTTPSKASELVAEGPSWFARMRKGVPDEQLRRCALRVLLAGRADVFRASSNGKALLSQWLDHLSVGDPLELSDWLRGASPEQLHELLASPPLFGNVAVGILRPEPKKPD